MARGVDQLSRVTGACVRARGVDQLSRATRARVQGPEVLTSTPG